MNYKKEAEIKKPVLNLKAGFFILISDFIF